MAKGECGDWERQEQRLDQRTGRDFVDPITSLVVQMLKNLPAWWGRDPSMTPGSRRSTGEGNGHPLQYYCLENSMDGGAWWATVHGLTKS